MKPKNNNALHKLVTAFNHDKTVLCFKIEELLNNQPSAEAKAALVLQPNPDGYTPFTLALAMGSFSAASQMVQEFAYFSPENRALLLKGFHQVPASLKQGRAWDDLCQKMLMKQVDLEGGQASSAKFSGTGDSKDPSPTLSIAAKAKGIFARFVP